MKILRSKIAFSLICAVAAIIIGTLTVAAQELPALTGLFSPRQIAITVTSDSASPSPVPLWTIDQKIREAKESLQNIQLSVGSADISYTESRVSTSGGKISTSTKKFKEPEKQIALAVMNTDNGQVQIITVTKRGADLIAPPGWNIEVLQRPSGIRWNGRNTSYRINAPENHVVIANVYPNETDTKVAQKKNGKTVYVTQREVRYDLYAPYSPNLHTSELVKAGETYTSEMVAKALEELRSAGVQSRATPGSLVADVFASRASFFTRIPLLEQTDLTEFVLDPKNTMERAHVIIGANKDQAFNITCNSSSACGWVQFTPKTYASIVKLYPAAKLNKDFRAGAADHLNSMKAAILLYDENLKGLIKVHGPTVVNDAKLEEYLASSYNGAPRHVYTTLKAALARGIADWINALTPKTGGLKDETKGYLVKLRWLQERDATTLADKAS